MNLSAKRGFTLVELLFTITVVILAGLGILGAYGSSLHLVEVAQQAMMANDDLKDMMEKLKSTAFTQLLTDFPDGAVNGIVGAGPDKYSAVVGGYRLAGEQITVTHRPNTSADPRELVVQLTWTNRGRLYQRTLSTFRTSRLS